MVEPEHFAQTGSRPHGTGLHRFRHFGVGYQIPYRADCHIDHLHIVACIVIFVILYAAFPLCQQFRLHPCIVEVGIDYGLVQNGNPAS